MPPKPYSTTKTNGNGSGLGEPLATYPYTDEHGKLLYEVLRYEGKAFRQRAPKDGGNWEWSIKGVRRVIYRLPKVLEAIAAGQPVYICEGEKDVAAIEWAGGVATCNSGGAGKWSKDYATWFKGARVIIVRDQDEVGAKHAVDIEASLSGIARKVVVVDPAEGKDAADHLTHGHTLAPWLAVLAPKALQRTLLGSLMRNGVTEPTRWHDWLYAGGLHTIQSGPGVGKTWIAIWMAVTLINQGYAVIYIDEEGGSELVTERLLLLGADPDLIDKLLFYFPFPEREWTPDDIEALTDILAEAGQTAQVAVGILDSLPDFLSSADKDENSAQDVTGFIRTLLKPFRDVDAALLVLDHLTRPDESVSGANKKRGRYARGSGAKLAKAHLTILVETDAPFDGRVSGQLKLWKTKDRRGRVNLPDLSRDPFLIDVTVTPERITFTPVTTVVAAIEKPVWDGPTECMAAILEFCQQHPDTRFSINKLTKSVINPATKIGGFRYPTVQTAAAILHKNGSLQYTIGPRGSDTYWFQLQEEMRSDDTHTSVLPSSPHFVPDEGGATQPMSSSQFVPPPPYGGVARTNPGGCSGETDEPESADEPKTPPAIASIFGDRPDPNEEF